MGTHSLDTGGKCIGLEKYCVGSCKKSGLYLARMSCVYPVSQQCRSCNGGLLQLGYTWIAGLMENVGQLLVKQAYMAYKLLLNITA